MPTEYHYNTWITDRTVNFLEKQDNSESPFCLFVSFPDPHHPFDPPGDYADRYTPSDMPLPDVTEEDLNSRPSYAGDLFPKGQGFRSLYWQANDDAEAGSSITTDDVTDESLQLAIAYTHAQVEMIDEGIGRMLQQLKLSGLDENTIVIFTSDHGDYLGNHGLLHKGPASYRQLTELSFIMRGPQIRAGTEIDSLTSHIDLMPTLLDLAGVSCKNEVDGVSLKPLLTGNASQVRDHTFGEYHPTVRHDLYNQTVYKDQWRMTLYPEHPEWGELFDLEADPLEHLNRFYDAESSSIKSVLSSLLEQEFPPQATVENETLGKW